jgi:hypothetical protein
MDAADREGLLFKLADLIARQVTAGTVWVNCSHVV